jgi:2-succinyl-5-enolpyruvyl-6-hydroxy-3-cyclohexene-1-carboxylate synthase
MPDFILYLGGAVVSKRLKAFLRNTNNARCWHINNDGQIYDTFKCLEGVVKCPLPQFIGQLNSFYGENGGCFDGEFAALWKEELKKAEEATFRYQLSFSSMMAVKLLEQKLNVGSFDVHYANSSAIRLANIYARHHVWCNRGINGIEGSLSTAAGFSLLDDLNLVFCVIGDLSFFYDQNALWNQRLKGNLRILLLNNGGGAIFQGLNGARQSPAFHTAIVAAHHTSAEGVCRQNNIAYQAATDEDSLNNGIEWLVGCPDDCQSPLLLEVFTSPETDNQAVTGFFACF